MANFSGLYYPGESWNLDLEDSTLKKCLIFFDKIYAIVPEVFSVDWKTVQPREELDPFLLNARRGKEKILLKSKEFLAEQLVPDLSEIERHDRIERFLHKVALLRSEGILEFVNPRENFLDPPYWNGKSGPYPWPELGNRYQKALQQGLSLEELEVHKPHVLYGSILCDLKNEDFRRVAANLGTNRVVLYKGQAEKNWLYMLGKASGFAEDEWQPVPKIGMLCGSFVGTVSTPMWAAFVVNHALLTAHKHNLIPVTPSDIFQELLQSKLGHLRTLTHSEQFDESYLGHPEYKAGFSGFSLAVCALPNLNLMSFEDVLDLRTEMKDELIAFRHEIFAFTEHIKSEPWTPSFQKEVEYTANHRIESVVSDLRRKLESSQKDVIARAMKNVTPKVLPVLGSIWAGIPLMLVMAVTAGLVSIETALNYYFERKKILQSNGLSLLIRLT
jgi:hypothetical protein